MIDIQVPLSPRPVQETLDTEVSKAPSRGTGPSREQPYTKVSRWGRLFARADECQAVCRLLSVSRVKCTANRTYLLCACVHGSSLASAETSLPGILTILACQTACKPRLLLHSLNLLVLQHVEREFGPISKCQNERAPLRSAGSCVPFSIVGA